MKYLDTTVRLICVCCKKPFYKSAKEFRRQVRNGRDKKHFCCSYHCGNVWASRDRKILRINVKRTCQYCGTTFVTEIRKTDTVEIGTKHCSRSCASVSSVTPLRRERAREAGLKTKTRLNLQTIATGLRTREAWKYVEIEKLLRSLGIAFAFEFPVANYVFDLAILGIKTLIEFDSVHHRSQIKQDQEKADMAIRLGWRVLRVQTEVNKVLDVSCIKDIVLSSSLPSCLDGDESSA